MRIADSVLPVQRSVLPGPEGAFESKEGYVAGVLADWIARRAPHELADESRMLEGLTRLRRWAAWAWLRRAETPADAQLDAAAQADLLREMTAYLAASGMEDEAVECLETIASGLDEQAASG